MARITVEDCLDKIPNRFQLVLAATYRARMLSQGHTPKVECQNKPAVTALREIAAGKVLPADPTLDKASGKYEAEVEAQATENA